MKSTLSMIKATISNVTNREAAQIGKRLTSPIILILKSHISTNHSRELIRLSELIGAI